MICGPNGSVHDSLKPLFLILGHHIIKKNNKKGKRISGHIIFGNLDIPQLDMFNFLRNDACRSILNVRLIFSKS